MADFEDVRLCDLLDKVRACSLAIAQSRNVSEFKKLGQEIQGVYDFFVTAAKSYEEQQPPRKNLF